MFVSLPEVIKDAGVNQFPGLDGGLLGSQYAPFRIEANAERSGFVVPDIFLPADVTAQRLEDRRLLLGQRRRPVSGPKRRLLHGGCRRPNYDDHTLA